MKPNLYIKPELILFVFSSPVCQVVSTSIDGYFFGGETSEYDLDSD